MEGLAHFIGMVATLIFYLSYFLFFTFFFFFLEEGEALPVFLFNKHWFSPICSNIIHYLKCFEVFHRNWLFVYGQPNPALSLLAVWYSDFKACQQRNAVLQYQILTGTA